MNTGEQCWTNFNFVNTVEHCRTMWKTVLQCWILLSIVEHWWKNLEHCYTLLNTMLINDAKIGRLYDNVKYCWTMLNTDGKRGNLFDNVEHSWTMLNTDEKCVKLLNTVGQFWTQFTTVEHVEHYWSLLITMCYWFLVYFGVKLDLCFQGL